MRSLLDRHSAAHTFVFYVAGLWQACVLLVGSHKPAAAPVAAAGRY